MSQMIAPLRAALPSLPRLRWPKWTVEQVTERIMVALLYFLMLTFISMFGVVCFICADAARTFARGACLDARSAGESSVFCPRPAHVEATPVLTSPVTTTPIGSAGSILASNGGSGGGGGAGAGAVFVMHGAGASSSFLPPTDANVRRLLRDRGDVARMDGRVLRIYDTPVAIRRTDGWHALPEEP